MKSSVKSFAILFGLVAAFSFAACTVSVNPKESKPKYTVEFDSMGGSAVDSQIVVKGQKITLPQDPTKPENETEGFVFANWYTSTDGGNTLSESPFDFNTPIKANLTLYAKWNSLSQDGKIPLTLEFINSGTLSVSGPWSTLKYSKNGGDLTDYTGDITVAARDRICLYAQESENTSSSNMMIDCSSDCYIYGNVMSLVTLDPQTSKWNPYTSSVQSYAFFDLFYNNRHIKNHSEKKVYLPATTLADHCYYYMFYHCTSLTIAPELPATTLADYCYYYMFYGCTNLMTAPALPAKTLAFYCYSNMFYYCTSLTTAPDLPATTLAVYCYNYMFGGCTSLTTAPDLPATILTDHCYSFMFSSCASLTVAPELPAITLADHCYYYMFRDCKTLTTAPDLPATTLADYCYNHMFNGCTNLMTAPDLPAIKLSDHCYQGMFSGCTSLTTAPELPATTLADYCYYYMFYGCTKLNSIKCLATDISASDCTGGWVYRVSQTGTFIKNKNMNDWATGSDGIPSGWTVKNAN
ncbi:MAG: InlB B-repeat-containing protein [Treponema sp.]|nr:InlB B-repeat-containing protein [Treponema sp.]